MATQTSELLQVEAKYPQDIGVLESLTAPLFDDMTFDPEKAWHDVMRKSETVESARSAYELAKADAADAKKTLDTRQKELEDLIKELRWKEQRADQAKLQPKLQVAPGAKEMIDAVEGMGGLSTNASATRPDDGLEDTDALGNPWPEVLGNATGEGDEGELGASDDPGGDNKGAR